MSRSLTTGLARLTPRKVRTQLIVGVALVHLVMMSIFVADLVQRQKRFLEADSLDDTRALADALAVNSSSWLLANDVVGLGELIQSVRKHTGVRYAMVHTPDGLVLAHSREGYRGLYLTDARSLALRSAPPTIQVVAAGPDLIDVAAPVLTSRGECIGWARVGMDQAPIAESLRAVARSGLLYILLAILFGSVFAIAIGSRLTKDLNALLALSAQVRDGRRDVRARAGGANEVAALGQGLNEMVDALAAGEERVRREVETRLRLAAIVESSHDGIIGKKLDGTVVSWNAAAETLYGYTEQEILGRPVSVLAPENHVGEIQDILDRVRGGELVKSFETVRVRKDGRRISVSLTVSPIRDASGAIVGASTIARDVTERRRMEEELQRSEQSLRDDVAERKRAEQLLAERSRMLESVFAHTQTCLALLDREFNFLRVNDAYARACQKEPSEFLGHNHFEFYPSDELKGRFERVVRTKEVYRVQARPFSFPDHPEWGVTYWDLTVVPIEGSRGEVEWVVFALNDVTERKKGEEAQRAASQYARTLLEASLDPLVTISPEGEITDVNRATEEVTGVERAGLVGTDFADYFTERERARDGYREVLAEGFVRDYPLTIRHRDGRTTDVLYNANVYRNEAGEVQ